MSWSPDAGDIVWMNFDPQAGREQAGHRPAVIVSPAKFNRRTGFVICVPLTTRIKGYPFEVGITGSPPSVALVDHVRSVDWHARKATLKGRATPAELARIRALLQAMIG